jgi:hypothetical protein
VGTFEGSVCTPNESANFLLDMVLEYVQTAELAGMTDKMKFQYTRQPKRYIISMVFVCEHSY